MLHTLWHPFLISERQDKDLIKKSPIGMCRSAYVFLLLRSFLRNTLSLKPDRLNRNQLNHAEAQNTSLSYLFYSLSLKRSRIVLFLYSPKKASIRLTSLLYRYTDG